jgi:hypothetical protein
MAQLSPSDYRTAQPAMSGQEHSEGIMDQVSETARDMGDRAGAMASELGAAIKERPYTTLAIAAGLAFAVGALWKLNQRQPQSRLDSWLAQVPELPNAERLHSLLPRRWR